MYKYRHMELTFSASSLNLRRSAVNNTCEKKKILKVNAWVHLPDCRVSLHRLSIEWLEMHIYGIVCCGFKSPFSQLGTEDFVYPAVKGNLLMYQGRFYVLGEDKAAN